jgi:2-keto-4-pentenoate hydratase
MNAGFVYGPAVMDWSGSALIRQGVALTMDDETSVEHPSGSMLQDPIESLVWLANFLNEHDLQIHAGEFVASASHVGLVPWQPGRQVGVSFEHLGGASCREI